MSSESTREDRLGAKKIRDDVGRKKKGLWNRQSRRKPFVARSIDCLRKPAKKHSGWFGVRFVGESRHTADLELELERARVLTITNGTRL